ncbi:hypothetical protein ACP6C3_30410 [Mycolicibacterium septicum]|jgi:hypothetical protein|uniref:Lipoprotein LpqS n=2 Tax=Mycolicibacterium TaxID=1866885 RepID=A0A1A2UZ30_9MYCO|nr:MULTISPECIES: hypothetical protein [Mycolicibacterium]OCB42890.1 hypothetical protein A5721_26280 [Mycolicibacterium vulneris]MCW1824044.1 hypothetical protein [Mycolicibacterium senegalense]OBB04208.1 hypothetical protein A5718_26550 [Mycolicibacterium conceptionense]OBE94554.1 hypothetical protein A5731_27175 [Mycolicibacterium conceptionense]OBF19955.1 hypothetical protein A5726_16695 [Mycolicibacterium conceptionense]
MSATAKGLDTVVSTIARFVKVLPRHRWRPVLLLALALSVLATGGVAVSSCPTAIGLSSASAVGGPALAAGSVDGVVADHLHAAEGLTSCPEEFAIAVLPRPAGAVAALGVVIAVVWAWRLWGFSVWSAMRAPPTIPAVIASGQQVLIRLCVARR